MKQRNIKRLVVVAIALLAGSFLFSSYRVQESVASDLWNMLGLSKQSGTEGIKNSFLNGYLYYYGAKNAKNIAVNDRPALARDLLNYTKEYVNGAEFKKQYDDMRKNSKPIEPAVKTVRTLEQVQKDEIAKTEKSLKDTEKNMKEMTTDMAKNMQPLVDMLKQNLKDYKDIKNPYFSMIVQGEVYENENNAKRYQEDKARWEKTYPAAVNSFVAERLKRMLEATKDIDYNAELVEKYNKKRFVNQKYEYKNTEWKQGFRAGKAVTEMAREFVKNWLAEIK